VANFNSVYNFIASDKFSKVLASFEKSSEAAERKVKSLQAAVAKTSTTFDKMRLAGGRMKSLAGDLKWYSAAATGFLAIGFKEWTDQEKAIAKVSKTLANTGNRAGFTSRQLQDAADKMSMGSLYEADDILNQVTNRMLTFGNITGTTLSRGQQAVVDMAAAMEMDLGSASLLVGKALSRPSVGMMALKKAGIVLTAQQENYIKTLEKSGQKGLAQAKILDLLEGKFKGQAKVIADTQPMQKMSLEFKNMAESMGSIIAPVLVPLIHGITRLMMALSSSHPVIKGAAGAILILMAVSVPLLFTMGAITTALPVLITGFLALSGALGVVGRAMLFLTTNPAGLFITGIAIAIAAVIYGIVQLIKNWEKVKATFKSWMPDSSEHKLTQEAITKNQNSFNGNIDVSVKSDKGTTAKASGATSTSGVTFNRGRTM